MSAPSIGRCRGYPCPPRQCDDRSAAGIEAGRRRDNERGDDAMERTVDPDSVGLDPRQLATIDRHFAAYVDDGRLAGWQLVIGRKGEVAHASTYGLANLETGTA